MTAWLNAMRRWLGKGEHPLLLFGGGGYGLHTGQWGGTAGWGGGYGGGIGIIGMILIVLVVLMLLGRI